jgi:predicted Zn-dependent peptidase
MNAVLENGVVFLSEPIVTSHTVAVGFWFSIGSRYEKENQKGITHFVEHLIFKGTYPSTNCPKGRTAYDIACAFDRMGGYVNAFTEREEVCLYFVVPYNNFHEALDIVCDMSFNSSFQKSDIEKERSVICSEILSAQDDPEDAALDTLAEKIWPKNSISTSIAGSVNDVKKIHREELISWYEKNFIHGGLQISIAGNFDDKDAIRQLEKLPKRKEVKSGLQKNTLFKVPMWNKGFSFEKADFQMEQIFCSYPLDFPFTATKYYCWAILNALIGDTMSSRLFQSLRENGGYCYNVYSFFSIYDDCGFWCAYTSAPSEKTVSIIKKLNAELENLRTEELTDAEIQAAKEHLCGEEIINAEDIEQRMKKMSRLFALGFKMETVEETVANIRAITKSELRLTLDKLLCKENQAMLIYGPKLKQNVKKWL